jgi:hypothetical protein
MNKTIKKRLLLGFGAIVFGAGLLMAHGDPLLGTVTAVDKDTITIKGKDNKPVIVMVDAKTKYLTGSKAAKMSDVKVGTKVSIDAEMDTKMKMYVAESVTLPAAAVTATTAAKPAAKAATAPAAKAPATK